MDNRHVTLDVNGRPVSTEAPASLTLLRFLRDELRLTSAKDGCSQGHCGTCMVLIDGKPTLSCLVKVASLSGQRVETIEGISANGRLHPVQQTLIDYGAVQCGFCIPGMVISAKALLDKKLHPSTDEVKRALRLHLCRCGGYPKIIQAVQAAGRIMAGEDGGGSKALVTGHAVGSSFPDKDGIEKVTGQIQYADDLYVEGMLYGKALWSQYPHAEILEVDTKEAKRMPGVQAVLTAKDVPGRNEFGFLVRHQPVLAG
ncbi:MAG: 2Fe-2S iron-sulfur cluster-binding protein, partial [Chloroflexota bacterium]|nr:2Fe-2S iron-sulfur cluster-binding protein [Chloroflexota bacterium]